MFTGIIETIGMVSEIIHHQNNIDFWIVSPLSTSLKIDQSVSHNGICLTVVEIKNESHRVTAIAETLKKTNLGKLNSGDFVNIERCMIANGRYDGHIVQGHVDQIGTCISVKDEGGSFMFTFQYNADLGNITVEKGSICVNGVSLTVVNSNEDNFSVCIIPYTLENTNFKAISKGDTVNLEFDIIGKYIAKILKTNGTIKS